MPKCLAIDIGASGGRHIFGQLADGKLVCKEIYRFENNVTQKDGHLVWDMDHLKQQVIRGLAACKQANAIPDTVAIDTWGVDYVLLDKNDKEILPVYAYRDSRGAQAAPAVEAILSPGELYARTGIQRQTFNTVYQIYADKAEGRLEQAERLLMIPEYLSFVLCGKKANEYTNSTTTGLLNATDKIWDREILTNLGLPARLFAAPTPPATLLGGFTEEIKAQVGFDCQVVLCPTHDTASAVAAAPLEEGDAYISSGTWSLMGVELSAPITTPAAQNANITNEGGVEYRFRFLKNIMGLWMIQSIRRETGKKYSFPELAAMARNSSFPDRVDVNDNAFFAPDSMIGALRNMLNAPGLPLADVLGCVYHSLAQSYAATLKELEQIIGRPIQRIRIVGGGCQDDYLNELTARYTGKPVTAGPVEATATGNLLSQLMALDKQMTLADARAIVKNTFSVKEV